MNIVMSEYLVRNASGAVDTAATLVKFETDMAKFVADTETEVSVIADAVGKVFDEHKSTLAMPVLTAYALQKLNAQPSNFKVLEKRVMDYVRSNADQPAIKDGDKVIREAEAPRSRLFRIAKGVGGGVSRWSDIPEKTETPSAA